MTGGGEGVRLYQRLGTKATPVLASLNVHGGLFDRLHGSGATGEAEMKRPTVALQSSPLPDPGHLGPWGCNPHTYVFLRWFIFVFLAHTTYVRPFIRSGPIPWLSHNPFL